MKKTFMLLKGRKEVVKFALCVVMTVLVIGLYFVPEESVAVFGDLNSNTPKSLFGLVGRWVK